MDSDFNRRSATENARQTSNRGINPSDTLIHLSGMPFFKIYFDASYTGI
jgi:hypothetical protein